VLSPNQTVSTEAGELHPTSAADLWEMYNYPVGTLADRNYRSVDVYDAGLHAQC